MTDDLKRKATINATCTEHTIQVHAQANSLRKLYPKTILTGSNFNQHVGSALGKIN